MTYANTNDKLTIVGGVMGGQVLDSSGVKALATLPSSTSSAARSSACSWLRRPVARVLQAPAGQLAGCVNAYADKER